MRLPLLLQRCMPSLVAAALYAVFILLWHIDRDAFHALQTAGSYMSDVLPYADLNSVLQANGCAWQGVNVYAPNACMGGGVYNYSPLLLRVLPGIGTGARVPLGLVFGALFLAAATLLPPAQGGGALAVRLCALCSGVVIWALGTANLDVVLFALCVPGLCLLLTGRAAGYVLFAVAAAVKFYPAVLLALVLREPRRRFAVIAALLLLCAGVFMWRYGQGVLAALTIVPGGLPFRGVFGALNWPFGLVLLRFLPVLTMEPDAAQYLAAMHQPHVMAYIVLSTRLLVVLGVYAAWRLAPFYAAPLRTMPEAEALFLAAGCIVICFCFFMAQNLDYRAIFLLLTLPGLQYLERAGSGRWMLAAVLLLMWEGALRHAVAVVSTPLLGAAAPYVQAGFWLLREIIWWLVAVRLAAIAIAYLRAVVSALLAGPAVRTAD